MVALLIERGGDRPPKALRHDSNENQSIAYQAASTAVRQRVGIIPLQPYSGPSCSLRLAYGGELMSYQHNGSGVYQSMHAVAAARHLVVQYGQSNGETSIPGILVRRSSAP